MSEVTRPPRDDVTCPVTGMEVQSTRVYGVIDRKPYGSPVSISYRDLQIQYLLTSSEQKLKFLDNVTVSDEVKGKCR